MGAFSSLQKIKIGIWSGILFLGVSIGIAITPFVLLGNTYVVPPKRALFFFGSLLFNSLSYSVVGIPLYVLFAAILLVRQSVSLRLVIGWTSSIIPFLFIGAAANLLLNQGDYRWISLFASVAILSTVLWVVLVKMIPKRASCHGWLSEEIGVGATPLLVGKSQDENASEVEETDVRAEASVVNFSSTDIDILKNIPSAPKVETGFKTVEFARVEQGFDGASTPLKNTTEDDFLGVAEEDIVVEENPFSSLVQEGGQNPESMVQSDTRAILQEDNSGHPHTEEAVSEISHDAQSRRSDEAIEYVESKPGSKEALNKYSRQDGYIIPTTGILQFGSERNRNVDDGNAHNAANRLIETLAEFGIPAEVTAIQRGSAITRFEVLPDRGIRLGRISAIADNIALRLAAERVRIVAPIPGKEAVGIEIPSKHRNTVHFGDLIENSKHFWNHDITIPIILGEGITGEECIIDLTKTPHMLIAGATGSGKSVCINTLICSILYRCPPEDVKLILIDPKIVELSFYNNIPHLLTPVITDARYAYQILQYSLCEMERRYAKLEELGVRDITSYNKEMEAQQRYDEKLTYMVIIIDEFADLMLVSGKDLEALVSRLAAMSRAIGIHLVLATQRPSTDVITGLIKANVPSRIAFMVSSKVDSRIILDAGGAEALLGRGDMLFTSSWDSDLRRIQGSFLSEDEVRRIVGEVKRYGKPEYIDDELFIDDRVPNTNDLSPGDDPLLKDAINLILQSEKASTSFLQRKFKIGYNRAARLIETMEEQGIVGPLQGSNPREILIKNKM